VAADDEVYVLDTEGRVLRYGPDGSLIASWWMPDTEVGRPEGVRVLQDGRVAVADTHYHRIVFFSREGRLLSTMGSHGTGPGQFIYPVAITQDNETNLYVAEYGSNDRVQKFSVQGKFIGTFGAFGTNCGEFQRPSGLAWFEEKIYVADAINNRVQTFTGHGVFEGLMGLADSELVLRFPYDIAVTGQGQFYIVEYGAGRITCLDRQGSVLGQYGRTGSGEGEFSTPWGIGVNSRGHVIVADTGNRRIVELQL
jgi:DNA-binding beta-propeller fold protein YncE